MSAPVYAGEPLIHSHITDGLPERHALANTVIRCLVCQGMVHCSNNECMTTWVECNAGAYCLQCFAKELTNTSDCIVDAEQLGLNERSALVGTCKPESAMTVAGEPIAT